MTRKLVLWLLMAGVSLSVGAKNAVDYVDPMIGTGSKRADEGNAGGN